MYNKYNYSDDLLSSLFSGRAAQAAQAAIIITILSFVIAFVCTILTLILITPEKRRAALPKFFQFCHDLFNVKWLLIEKILKALYVFCTLFIITYGFLTLFRSPGAGFLTMLLGPVLIRLWHELMMIAILTLKNLISINQKLSPTPAENDAFSSDFSKYMKPKTSAAATVTCTSCGAPIESGATFCSQCGAKQN